MTDYECRILAERLAIKSIKSYEMRFLLEQDLLSGVDRQKVVAEMEKIINKIKGVKTNDKKDIEKDYI